MIDFKNIDTYMTLNLSFFEGEKTEQATAKKKEEARSEGQIAKSPEIGTAFLFICIFSFLKTYGSSMYVKISEVFYYTFDMLADVNIIFDVEFMSKLAAYMFSKVILICMPIFLVAMVVGVVVNFLQVGWKPTTKPLKPKFSKINPISGFKRMFSMKLLVDLVKNLAKFGIILYVVYSSIKSEIDVIPVLYQMDVVEIVMIIGSIITGIGVNVGVVYIVVALVDYMYNRWKHNKDLKMSKQEIKEEYKMSEGNPQVKGQIRQRMREASMRRMMNDVPGADVIITNPTHYAVAIKYDRFKGGAPIVVAKGMDFLAKRIKEVAAENDIEIVENKPLARTLYADVDIGKEIPEELYQTIAEILAFVYKLKNKV